MCGRCDSLQVDFAATTKLLRNLIRIPSVNPAIEGGSGESAVASYIADWFRKTHHFRVYEQKVSKNRFNVVAVLGGGEGKSLMLNGHMDTVGTSNMTVRPYKPFVEGGRMHGRGACDMKGSLASMMSAMAAIANSKQRLKSDVVFAGVVDEEYHSIGTSTLIKRFKTDAAIVGEPTQMDVAVAHKGYAWIEAETVGKRAHGSVPEQGVDAIEEMGKILSELRSLRSQYRLKVHPLLGTPKIHTSTIVGGSEWSSVPANCKVQLERRLLPGEDAQSGVNEIRNVVNRLSKHDKKMHANIRLIYSANAMEVSARAAHTQILRKSIRHFGGRGNVIGVPYWTDAAILVNKARIPTCVFGPGDIRVAHAPDEYVNIRDVANAARIYSNTVLEYCGFR